MLYILASCVIKHPGKSSTPCSTFIEFVGLRALYVMYLHSDFWSCQGLMCFGSTPTLYGPWDHWPADHLVDKRGPKWRFDGHVEPPCNQVVLNDPIPRVERSMQDVFAWIHSAASDVGSLSNKPFHYPHHELQYPHTKILSTLTIQARLSFLKHWAGAGLARPWDVVLHWGEEVFSCKKAIILWHGSLSTLKLWKGFQNMWPSKVFALHWQADSLNCVNSGVFFMRMLRHVYDLPYHLWSFRWNVDVRQALHPRFKDILDTGHLPKQLTGH